MSLNPLSWIRAQVKAAVLAGFGDALAQLDDGGDVHAAAARLAALPAPPAAPVTLDRPDAADGLPDAGNGRRRKHATA
jgi:hypothetical protein